jgi:hypothetical protein
MRVAGVEARDARREAIAQRRERLLDRLHRVPG